MKSNTQIYYCVDLQLFAEGGGGESGASEGGSTGATAPAAEVLTGENNTPAAEVKTKDRISEFESLIKGKYKDLYDARVQDIVQKRLKGQKELVERYNELTPTLETLAKKYGVDASDIKALNKAIEEDDSYYEDEALERGISVQQLKEIKKIERENAEFKRQQAERERIDNANKQYKRWMEQSEETKKVYPLFDLRAELQNSKFFDLLSSNIDVRTAYEVVHRDEIIAGAMQFAAKKAEQNVTNSIIANGTRPSENGNSSQSASVSTRDPSKMTRKERAEYNRRISNGERITFG